MTEEEEHRKSKSDTQYKLKSNGETLGEKGDTYGAHTPFSK